MTQSHPFPYSIKRHGTTLEKCENEPVQTPGCIQAFGVLLALRPRDLAIVQVSENCAQWLSVEPAELLGKSIEDLLGAGLTEKIRAAIDREPLERIPLFLFTLEPGQCGNSRRLHACLHTSEGVAILELEDAGSDAASTAPAPDYYALVRKTLNRFQSAFSLDQLAQIVTEEIQHETGLDRVMVYYFHEDESGRVIAETKRKDLDSWLQWRYPAHDIPRPAREIFKKIWSRPVPDVKGALYEVVPLLNPDSHDPLDMTYCALRGASVMYTEYLDNMGVGAAFTLPLMMEGELWGLIACHHYTPRLIPHATRAACEFLAKAASQQLKLVEEKENSAYRASLQKTNHALISKMAVELEFSAFTQGTLNLLSALDAKGAAILTQGHWHKVGNCPTDEQLDHLQKWLEPQWAATSEHKPVFVTDGLPSLFQEAKDFQVIASGILAFRYSADPLGVVIWFRPETLQTFTWAGNPYELPVVAGPHGPRLSPRKSFEVWCETVSGRCLPWKSVEVESVATLRRLIIDLIVSRGGQLESLRSALRLSRARFDVSLDAAELGAWEMDLQSRDLWRTPRHDIIFGHDRPVAQWNFRNFIDAVHADDRSRVSVEIEESFRQMKPFEIETRIVDARSKTRWIWFYGTPIEQGTQKLFVGLVEDISEKVRSRDLLASRGEHLESLVEARTAELSATIGELEAFSYSISHDMRSPLRAMQGFSQALLDDYRDKKLDEEGREFLQRIERGARRLDVLIRDVLSYSTVAKKMIETHPVALDALLKEIIQEHAEFQEPCAAILQELLPGKVMGHEPLLAQIFANLLSNAIKFQLEGTQPRVTVTSELQGNWIKVWVCDNGIGIDPSNHERIFQIFGRVHPQKTFDGTGIGLAIVKKAVERMGGTIGVDSELGHGSEFWFTLKRAS